MWLNSDSIIDVTLSDDTDDNGSSINADIIKLRTVKQKNSDELVNIVSETKKQVLV